jgi:hypothetical protein
MVSADKFHCSVKNLQFTIHIFFFCLALLAKVGTGFHRSLLVDVYGILGAVLTPMPLIILASPNILHRLSHLDFLYP